MATTGMVVTLMSSDANRMGYFLMGVHSLWVLPITMGVGVYLLWVVSASL